MPIIIIWICVLRKEEMGMSILGEFEYGVSSKIHKIIIVIFYFSVELSHLRCVGFSMLYVVMYIK
jgi:hypothetical protein